MMIKLPVKTESRSAHTMLMWGGGGMKATKIQIQLLDSTPLMLDDHSCHGGVGGGGKCNGSVSRSRSGWVA